MQRTVPDRTQSRNPPSKIQQRSRNVRGTPHSTTTTPGLGTAVAVVAAIAASLVIIAQRSPGPGPDPSRHRSSALGVVLGRNVQEGNVQLAAVPLKAVDGRLELGPLAGLGIDAGNLQDSLQMAKLGGGRKFVTGGESLRGEDHVAGSGDCEFPAEVVGVRVRSCANQKDHREGLFPNVRHQERQCHRQEVEGRPVEQQADGSCRVVARRGGRERGLCDR
mmetsp:Transcript_3250/g.7839  ORF Transcript_3250/g.7839 Transcript_3250/m.7839 type:complete len:220 (+) Transcript_3250:704-1363(+)